MILNKCINKQIIDIFYPGRCMVIIESKNDKKTNYKKIAGDIVL